MTILDSASTATDTAATAAAAAQESQTELLLQRAESAVRASRRAGATKLQVAYQWAICHRHVLPLGPGSRPTDRTTDSSPRHGQGHKLLGAVKYAVSEYAPTELAISLQTHPLAAQRLMADALDLTTRLPNTWAAVHALAVEDWVARKIAAATRDLTDEQAQWVDLEVAALIETLPTGRLLSVVEAKVVAADTEAADEQAQKARTQHLVHLSAKTRHGSRNLFARCEAADATRFWHMCDLIAHQLADASDHDPDSAQPGPETIAQLRARAIGILADPAGAAAFPARTPPAATPPSTSTPAPTSSAPATVWPGSRASAPTP